MRLFAAAFLALAAVPAFAQVTPRRDPPPEGRRLEARDGDVIVVENDDRVSVVRRRPAAARVVVDEARNLIVVLADWNPPGVGNDGVVDQAWRMSVAEGRWPLDARWEGPVVIEEGDGMVMRPGSNVSIETPSGVVLFYSGPVPPANSRGAIAVLRLQGFSAGSSPGLNFDQSEQLQLSDNPPAGQRFSIGGPSGRAYGGMSAGGTWASSASSVGAGASNPIQGKGAPLRVGGGIPPPRKIHDVTPVFPEEARQSGVQGVVILEITVAEDGTVQNPRVLRSIPLLDQAALEAVSQWRFEPPLLNGQPVPVIMTVTVQFSRQ
jgi:protein TonB